MGDLKLFRLQAGKAVELPGSAVALEKSLQTLIEQNMEALFGVRCLASEYSTGKKHGGRMDSLGIDENGSPVIFEYKRAVNENVITQGLYYLDWLMDHRGDFELLVLKALGDSTTIDWSSPRLVCVAGDFNKYDEYAVAQMNRSIDLVRYRRYEEELLALELVASTTGAVLAGAAALPVPPPSSPPAAKNATPSLAKTVSQLHQQAPTDLHDLYGALEAALLALGDDVSRKVTMTYYAFRRLKNFACVEVRPQSKKLLVYLKLDPSTVTIEPGFTRDVSNIGHFGTGDLEITLTSMPDLERAQPLLAASYAAN